MFTFRKFFIFLLIMLVFLVSVSTASATGSTTTRQVIRDTVNWSLGPETCPKLTVPLSGVGKRIEVITTTTYANGSQHIVDDAVISGPASDSTGSYNFLYVNHFVQDVPAGSGPVQVFMTDLFVMKGNGSAHLNEAFIWRWTYTPPAELWPPQDNWKQIYTKGDPLHCDPL